MARRFLDLPPHKPGYCWWNVAPLGEDPVWEERVAPWTIATEGKLFCYNEAEFMAKQYKRKAA
jgi:hypothetical protein